MVRPIWYSCCAHSMCCIAVLASLKRLASYELKLWFYILLWNDFSDLMSVKLLIFIRCDMILQHRACILDEWGVRNLGFYPEVIMNKHCDWFNTYSSVMYLTVSASCVFKRSPLITNKQNQYSYKGAICKTSSRKLSKMNKSYRQNEKNDIYILQRYILKVAC